MHTVSLTELRRTPGAALDHVRAGGEVLITQAGVPLCRMVPVDRSTTYEQLVAEGLLRPPTEQRDPVEIREASLRSWRHE